MLLSCAVLVLLVVSFVWWCKGWHDVSQNSKTPFVVTYHTVLAR